MHFCNCRAVPPVAPAPLESCISATGAKETPGMNARQPGTGPGIDRSRNIEDLHHLRLMSLLDEMVQDKGVMRAARDLGVNYRTLANALESGRLSRRMQGALENALLSGGGSPAREQRQRNDELAGRVEKLEEQVKVVAEDSGQSLPAVHGEIEALRNEHGQALQRVDSRLAQVERGEGGGSGGSAQSAPPGKLAKTTRSLPRRDFPDLATLEPAADDEDVFGDAWPLVQEWRGLRNTHPDKGRGLEWLRDEERLMSVELALLDDHGLTLPPQTFPLRGLDRGDQTRWRRTALEDARRARRRLERLRWPLRMLTGGRCFR